MTDSSLHADVIVIGAGAAGLMCAATAAQLGHSVLVLEHNDAPGRKVLVSGGGRCNFTNLNVDAGNFICGNSHFVKSALARFTPRDFLDMVEDFGIEWEERSHGQLFCRHSSKAILGLLLDACRVADVDIQTGVKVRHVVSRDDGFSVATATGDLSCSRVVVATGGLSWQQLGATDLGLSIARSFGLPVTELRPGLAPLDLDGSDLSLCCDQSGFSLPARLTCNGTTFDDALLLTHHGLSGPVALQASNYWLPGSSVSINLLPDQDPVALFEAASGRLPAQVLGRQWSKRFARAWCARHGFGKPWAESSRSEMDRLAATVSGWTVYPVGTGGYDKAEITVGGVDTQALSSKTMEAKSVPGLFFIGEVVDVTGWLGGYNFQWAWASGIAAGEAI